MTSCLGDDNNEDDYIVSTDSQLTDVVLTSSRIPALATTSFTIDQVRSLVYNHDSLPFGVDTTGVNVKLSYVTGSGFQNFQTDVDGDTAWIANGDSVRIAQLSRFNIYAPNGNKKEYIFKINIHQVDPDSMQYSLLSEHEPILSSGNNKTIFWGDAFYTYVRESNNEVRAYSAVDLKKWVEISLIDFPENVILSSIQITQRGLVAYTEDGFLCTGHIDQREIVTPRPMEPLGQKWNTHAFDYPVVSVLGDLKTPQGEERLSLILNKQGTSTFAYLSEGNLYYGEPVPENFPVCNFSVVNNNQASSITVVESLASVWSTINGTYWAHLDNPQQEYPHDKGGNAFMYAGKLYYLGGCSSDFTYSRDVYTSSDGGIVWEKMEEKAQPFENYIPREQASLIVDQKGIYFYIIGGKNTTINAAGLTDIWRVAVNSQLFELRK
ncbi:DUF6242 domain-containing protein [Bacteroidales bacterium OttesenSCG-928-M06]|nr:DUF6242 domain-containing protein [Bacteroidales bacterium OttesenSCG-928-M06]